MDGRYLTISFVDEPRDEILLYIRRDLMSMPRPKHSCSGTVLSIALFGDRDEILKRFKVNGISPSEFGLQNIEDLRFVRIVPEFRRCTLASNPREIRPGFVLQVIPDDNLETGDRHSIFVQSVDVDELTYIDDIGTSTIPMETLMTWWDRTGRVYVRCSPSRDGCRGSSR